MNRPRGGVSSGSPRTGELWGFAGGGVALPAAPVGEACSPSRPRGVQLPVRDHWFKDPDDRVGPRPPQHLALADSTDRTSSRPRPPRPPPPHPCPPAQTFPRSVQSQLPGGPCSLCLCVPLPRRSPAGGRAPSLLGGTGLWGSLRRLRPQQLSPRSEACALCVPRRTRPQERARAALSSWDVSPPWLPGPQIVAVGAPWSPWLQWRLRTGDGCLWWRPPRKRPIRAAHWLPDLPVISPDPP